MHRESTKIVLYFIATAFAIYILPKFGIPQIIIKGIFLGVAFYMYSAKDDILWLVWLLVLSDAPGRLFTESSSIYRLPFYNLGFGASIGFLDLAIITYALKQLKYRQPSPNRFRGQLTVYIALGLAYFAISMFMGMSVKNIVVTVRYLLPWLWLLILPRYLQNEVDFVRVYRLLVPFVVLAFITWVQRYITGSYLNNILSGRSAIGGINTEESMVRGYSAIYITYYCIMQSLYMLAKKQHLINANTLTFMSILGTLTVILSGTRGWIIGLLVLYSSIFFMSGFGMFRQLIRSLVLTGFIAVAVSSVLPGLFSQFNYAITRLFTMEELLKGDLTAGGTLIRITERGPKVMAVFRENPIIGWGFTNTFYNNADIHVGNQTNLLNIGVLGFIIIHLVYLSIIMSIYANGRLKSLRHHEGNASLVYFYALISLFIIHSSSGYIWGFISSVPLFWSFVFASASESIS